MGINVTVAHWVEGKAMELIYQALLGLVYQACVPSRPPAAPVGQCHPSLPLPSPPCTSLLACPLPVLRLSATVHVAYCNFL